MQFAGPNNGTATVADINITNGVIKVIDTALVPPANATTVGRLRQPLHQLLEAYRALRRFTH